MKNEKNIFCLGCVASICSQCTRAHRHHPLIQLTLLHSSIHPFPLAEARQFSTQFSSSSGVLSFSARVNSILEQQHHQCWTKN
jgi:hypothetical protein